VVRRNAAKSADSASVYAHYCATSFIHASTWQIQTIASHAVSDYEGLTADFLRHQDGFFGAFQVSSGGKKHVVSSLFLVVL
jgi:hypothetical protein